MSYLNQYFDKIYLLNLHKRTDRFTYSHKRLTDFDISYERFGATDGSVMKLIWESFPNKQFTTPNYLACCISHLSIYRDAVDKGYQKILILEDDLLFNKNLNLFFNIDVIPEWEDIFYLGYIPLSDDLSMWNYGLGNNFIKDRFFIPKNLWGLYSYGISNSLMKELLSIYDLMFPMELDRYFVNIIQPRNKSIGISPQLFCCQDIYSDNMGQNQVNMVIRSVDSRFAQLSDYV